MAREFLHRLQPVVDRLKPIINHPKVREGAMDVGAIVASAVTGAFPGGPKGYAQYVGEKYDRGLVQEQDLDNQDFIEYGRWIGALGIVLARGDFLMAGLWYELVGTAATLWTNVRLRQHIDRNSRLNPKPPTTATP